jgi:muramidase (phage lysozyme)
MIKSKSFPASAPEPEGGNSSEPHWLWVQVRQRSTQFGKIALKQVNGLAALGVRRVQNLGWRNQLIIVGLCASLITLKLQLIPSFQFSLPQSNSPYPPLAMKGGDPYIRALMRTISASESNDQNPYGVLYGGTHVSDLGAHPDRCIKIANGPNQGMCTTAAGRYQFITTTWQEKANLYHPNPDGWLFWQHYSFDPVSQDQVVYNWLKDSAAWGIDIPASLKDGQLDDVLSRLSGTWTSLGYGIETNEMTPHLNGMYQKFLKEERSQAGTKNSENQTALPSVGTISGY